jgi:hypothetical protein
MVSTDHKSRVTTKVLGIRMRPALETEVRALASEEGEHFSVTLRRLVRLGLERTREQESRARELRTARCG